MENQPSDSTEEWVEKNLGHRLPQNWGRWLLPLIAATWSIFQLSLGSFLLLPSLYIRSIHLAFAMALVFLAFPAWKGPRWGLKGKFWSKLWDRERIPFLDLFLAILGALASLYIVFDYEGISFRQGLPLKRDIVAGVLLILLLLEAARRSLGPPLPIIALVFMLGSLFASDLPDFLATKDVPLGHLISKLTLSSEGVFGIPLKVSADTVYLFVLFGAMLEKAGGGRYFISLAFALLGPFRGGPAKAAVLASGMTGIVSGSSIANTVTTGTFTIPLMKKAGYPAEKAAAVEVAASTNGQLMPPIMGAAAFIIAEYCDLPYLEVVRCALVPAVLSYLTLLFVVHLEAKKLGIEGMARKDLPPIGKTLLEGIYFFLPLLFLIYELVIARRSATSAAFKAIVVLSLVIFIKEIFECKRKGESFKKSISNSWLVIWRSLVAGGMNMMAIGVAVAVAGIIVGVVSLGLGGKVTEIIHYLSGGLLIPMLLITALVSLILGMGLPTTANYIVMANITAPVILVLAGESGLVVPLIAAHLFCFYFGILADDTPPVGLAAYAASAIGESDPLKTGIQGFFYDMRTALLPFMFIFNLDLLLIGVEGIGPITWVFVTGLIAMFAFAALLQNHFHSTNGWIDRFLLFFSAAFLFQPVLLANGLGLGAPIFWQLLGILLFALVPLRQFIGVRQAHA